MKKYTILLAVLLVAICVTTLTLLPAEATGEIIASGTCGDDLTWTLDDNGLLTISGIGDMYNYSSDYQSPWCFLHRDSIQSVVVEEGVTSIGNYAFYCCKKIDNIFLPDTITAIGNHAFFECGKLSAVVIPEKITVIEEDTFALCNSLTTVAIPFGVKTIEAGAFRACEGLISVLIPDGVTTIGYIAFASCTNLSSISIPDSVTSIGRRAFENCSRLENITLPFVGGSANSNNYLGYIFGASSTADSKHYVPNSLKTVILTDACTYIGRSAFENCKGLINVVIPDSVTSIGEEAFKNCTNLTNIILPDSVTKLENYIFCGCSSLIYVTIGNNVSLIGDGVFYGCSDLWHVLYKGSMDQWNNISVGRDNAKLDAVARHYECTGEEITNYIMPEPTCTEGGNEYYACSDCNGIWEKTVEATGHAYIAETVVATCTEQGYVICTCAHCGDSYIDNYTDALGHTYESVVTEPTCQAGGYTTHTCTICGDSYVDSYTDPLPYVAGDVDGNNVVDTDDAIYLLYYTLFGEDMYPINQPCDYDGNGVVDTDDAIYLLYHTLFGEEDYPLCRHHWVEATCDTPKHCLTCGKTQGEMLGHLYDTIVAACGNTCYICGLCGDKFAEDSEEGTAHRYGQWEYFGDAPKRTRKHICTECGYSESQHVLSALDAYLNINSDVVGWIRIMNDENANETYNKYLVNYPIMHHPDEKNYYLHRDFYGTYDKNGRGSIYLLEQCDIFEPSDVLTLYGHAMTDGTMFGRLNRYTIKSFFDSHPYIQMMDLYEEHTYQVVCIFKTTATEGEGFPYHLYDDFEDEAEYEEFINGVRDLALLDSGIETQYGDKFLCLSTSEYTQTNGRLVLLAKRIG